MAAGIVATLAFTYQKHGTSENRQPSTTVGLSVDGRAGALHVDAPAETPEVFATAQIEGRWSLVRTDSPNTPVYWNGVNIRGDKVESRPLDQLDLDRVAERFDTVRLVAHWDDVQPTEDTDVANYLDEVLLPIIQYADQAEVDVVLDPLHLGGGTGFWIPEWAWQHMWGDGTRHPDDTFEVLSWRHPDSGKTLGERYLAAVLRWVNKHEAAGTFDNVVAFELVNEPHPPDSGAYANTDLVAELQAEWVQALRAIDADKPLVLTGYFGGNLANGPQVRATFVHADGTSRWANLIWTAHNYFSGVPFPDEHAYDADEDGFGDVDAKPAWRRGSRTGVRVSPFDIRLCYGQTSGPDGTGPYTCRETTSAERRVIRQRLIANVEAQDGVAQGANMPLFVGEFGVSRYAERHGKWYGTRGSQHMLCDHLIAYRSLHNPDEDAISDPDGRFDSVSWSVWNLDSRDDARGIYDAGENKWHDSPTPDGLAEPFNNTWCRG